jgi:hypothetical protein
VGLIYGAFLLLSIVWWLTRALVTWLIWRVIWKKASINNLVATFEKHNFPKPPTNLLSPDAWFADLALGEDFSNLKLEQKLAAGAHYLRVTEFAAEQGIIAMMRARATYEDVIAAYRATFSR